MSSVSGYLGKLQHFAQEKSGIKIASIIVIFLVLAAIIVLLSPSVQ